MCVCVCVCVCVSECVGVLEEAANRTDFCGTVESWNLITVRLEELMDFNALFKSKKASSLFLEALSD